MRYKIAIVVLLSAIALVGGVNLFYNKLNLPFLEALYKSVQLFALNLAEVKMNESLKQELYIYAHAGALATFMTVLFIFWGYLIKAIKYLKYIIFGGHTVVVGLGGNNKYFTDSLIKDGKKNIIIVEKDKNNPNLNEYGNYVIFKNNINEVIDKIALNKAEHIIVSTGNDLQNINIALKIIENKNKGETLKLTVHIEDKNLREIYSGETLLKSDLCEVHIYSFNEESARDLFEKVEIDGKGLEIINSDKSFDIAIVGSGNLAMEVLIEAIKLAHFPNENILNIHLFAKDVDSFKDKIYSLYPKIDELKFAKLCFYKLDNSFFNNSLLNKESLKHIILASSNQEQNFSYAINLIDKTYRKKIVDNKLQVTICTALYLNNSLKDKINKTLYNKPNVSKDICKSKKINFFSNVVVFANAKEICDYKNIYENRYIKLAKQMNADYNNSQEEKERTWLNSSVNDQESSIAQALHIKIKLKSLMFSSKKSNLNYDKLVEKNLKTFNLDIEKLNKKYKNYFPPKFESRFEKVLNSEHNRWITYHQLLNFTYAEQTCKPKKEHNCLLEFKDFKSDNVKATLIYDVYSVVYIPYYLASIGEEIVKYSDIEENNLV
jgi:hypothetical protein